MNTYRPILKSEFDWAQAVTARRGGHQARRPRTIILLRLDSHYLWTTGDALAWWGSEMWAREYGGAAGKN